MRHAQGMHKKYGGWEGRKKLDLKSGRWEARQGLGRTFWDSLDESSPH